MGWSTPLLIRNSCFGADAVPNMVTLSTVLHSCVAATPTPPSCNKNYLY